jgi:hypothetical protein
MRLEARFIGEGLKERAGRRVAVMPGRVAGATSRNAARGRSDYSPRLDRRSTSLSTNRRAGVLDADEMCPNRPVA